MEKPDTRKPRSPSRGIKVVGHYILGPRMNSSQGVIYTKEVIEKIKLPKSVPIVEHWDGKKMIGKATNIRRSGDDIVCDIDMERDDVYAVGPGMTVDEILADKVAKGITIERLSTTRLPVDERHIIDREKWR
jgi:hypothetical protein